MNHYLELEDLEKWLKSETRLYARCDTKEMVISFHDHPTTWFIIRRKEADLHWAAATEWDRTTDPERAVDTYNRLP